VLIDDPRVNFAISTRASQNGVDHLGIQVEEDEEVTESRERLAGADVLLFDEGETVCCYAKSDKSWVQDPSGIPWEVYKTMEDAPRCTARKEKHKGACCTPDTLVMLGMPQKTSQCGS